MELPTRIDLFAIGRRYITSRAKRLDASQVDVAGSDANLVVGAGSYMAAAVVSQQAAQVGATLLGSSEGDDLDRVIYDRYDRLPRKGASAAVVTVTISREAPGSAGTVAVGAKIATLGGIEYVLTTAAVFDTSSTAVTARAKAVLAGAAYKVRADELVKFSATPFDPALTVTNEDASAGGEDAETDAVYIERARQSWTAAARGTLGAVVFGALTVPGVVSASAEDVLDVEGLPAGAVRLYIADSRGVGNAALADAVRVALNEYRCGGVYVDIAASRPQLVSIRLSLVFRAGVDTLAVGEQVRNAVIGFVNSLGVGKPLLRNDLGSVLARFRSVGLIPTEGSIAEPIGDLYPAVGYTIRTSSELVTS